MLAPALSPETAAAVEISSRRAAAYVAEARRVRAEDYDRNLGALTQGDTEGFTPSAWDLTEESSRLSSRNAFFHYVPPRRAKIIRARIRRYERLKYLYELEHPLFSHPEFPEHPAATMWREGVSMERNGTGWGSSSLGQPRPAYLLTIDDDAISPPPVVVHHRLLGTKTTTTARSITNRINSQRPVHYFLAVGTSLVPTSK
ncbi:hypothetical protein B0H16DRAFT_1722567 [Mycena metata]|uniref:Uncharacterized protein n=1 Tax=Mycena metata TaxID=1033252 RepID=A0AAD7ND74_9AGAR|nr:hypothetical protein B0H16DRAFT_1722567 [Mycena metata]